jgi:ribosomal protein L30/L7E
MNEDDDYGKAGEKIFKTLRTLRMHKAARSLKLFKL